MKKLLSILAVSVFAFSANAGTLDDVKNRGFLKCGARHAQITQRCSFARSNFRTQL
jgi:hypothetical protein